MSKFIKPTSKASGDVLDIHEQAIEFLLYTKHDDVPCPWDAGIGVEEGKVILEGALSPGGPMDGGVCKVEVPIDIFSKYFELEVPQYVLDKDPTVWDAIIEAGWEEAK